MIVAVLDELGYLHAPDPASPQRLFFGRSRERPRGFHAHVVERGSSESRRHLAVRDYLRQHPAEATGYAMLKRELVAASPGDRLRYIAGKAEYVEDLERRALEWDAAR